MEEAKRPQTRLTLRWLSVWFSRELIADARHDEDVARDLGDPSLLPVLVLEFQLHEDQRAGCQTAPRATDAALTGQAFEVEADAPQATLDLAPDRPVDASDRPGRRNQISLCVSPSWRLFS